jgi:hypothetical protein
MGRQVHLTSVIVVQVGCVKMKMETKPANQPKQTNNPFEKMVVEVARINADSGALRGAI